jgi:hypothetical protein
MARSPKTNEIASSKASVKRRAPSVHPDPGQPAAPFQEQDAKRRQGAFTGKGEAPRKGSRSRLAVQPQKKAKSPGGKS